MFTNQIVLTLHFKETIKLKEKTVEQNKDRIFSEQFNLTTKQDNKKLISLNNEKVKKSIVDILKFRLKKHSTSKGTICVLDAEKLYTNIVKLLYAIASDVENPRKVHKGSYRAKVYDFVKKCNFDQTEIGSYVIKVNVPIESSDEGSVFEDDDCNSSMGRKVTRKIMDSANKIKIAIDKGENNRLLELPIRKMISANVYEAISGLALDSDDTEVEISAEWASMAPVKDSPSNVNFTEDYYEPLCDIAEALKRDDTEKNLDIIGYVQKLDSDINIKKRKNGRVDITYKDEEGRERKLKVILLLEDYNKAMLAHQKGYKINLKAIKRENENIEYISFDIIDERYKNSESKLF